MFKKIHPLFLTAVPDKVILYILKHLFAEPVLLRFPILILLLSYRILSVHLSPLVVFLVRNVKSNPLIEYSHTTRLTTHLNCDTHLARATIFNTRTSFIFMCDEICVIQRFS